MKPFPALALAFILLVSGCSHIPPEAAETLDETQLRFSQVKHGMSREEVIATLGPPKKAEEGRWYWESTYSWWNHESLRIDFDTAGKVQAIRTVHREANRPRDRMLHERRQTSEADPVSTGSSSGIPSPEPPSFEPQS